MSDGIRRADFTKYEARQHREILPGIIRTTMSYGDDSMMCVFEMKKGAVIPLHEHPASQNGFIISGKVELDNGVEGEERIAVAGDGYYIPSLAPHGMRVLEDTRIVENFSPCRPEFIVD